MTPFIALWTSLAVGLGAPGHDLPAAPLPGSVGDISGGVVAENADPGALRVADVSCISGRLVVPPVLPRLAPGALPPDLPGDGPLWRLDGPEGALVFLAVSMGNPHAVIEVDDVGRAPVARLGPWLQAHGCFREGVNVGFAQVLARDAIALRVYERGAGETLACGSGACAAVVAGILRGLLASSVRVETRGGELQIAWQGPGTPVLMTGPAVTVFEGEAELA